MVEEVNGVEVMKPEISGVFITLQFDEEIRFISSEELLAWVKKGREIFQGFIAENTKDINGKNIGSDFPIHIKNMLSRYHDWYEYLLKLAEEIHKINGFAENSILDIGIKEKKENFIHVCAKLFKDGFFPMQGSIGMCALTMSRVPVDLAKGDASQLPILPQSIAWLYAMSVLRKRQSRQDETAADVRLCVEAGRDQLNTLQKDIEEAQNKVVKYKKELDEFQKKEVGSLLWTSQRQN